MAMPNTSPKTYIINGSSSGVGAACALKLAQAGHNVVINFNQSQALALEVVNACQHAGAQTLLVQADMAKEADCQRLVDETVARFGQINGLVNSAAITQFVPLSQLHEIKTEDFLNIYNVNAIGPFHMMRACEKHMPDGSAIVNVSSIAGQIGSGSSIPYVLSKSALNSLTLAMARVLAPRIRVNAVLPGVLQGRWMRDGLGEEAYEQVIQQYADKTALGKVALPEQIADAVVWLLQPDAMITGQHIVVDGGFVLGKLPPVAGSVKN
jgi:3-oxoacyl-[acyl-carrier protein] reductase